MKTSSFVIGALAGAALGTLFAPRRGSDARRALGRTLRNSGDEEPHTSSATALAAEALLTGIARYPAATDGPEIPQEEDLLRMGDPDVSSLGAAYVGDEAPGGDMTTPDQDGIDEVGRAFGLSEAGEGELRSSAEILTRRDRHR